MAWRRPFSGGEAEAATVLEGQREEIADGSTHYIAEKGGNNAQATYQDATGAPVENNSPLGYSVGPVTITLLNITMMIGAGIYSTRRLSMSCCGNNANLVKHLPFFLVPALLVSVSSTGLSVIW